MGRTLRLYLLGGAIVALLLQGCVAKEDMSGVPYDPTIRSNFLKSCFAGNHDKAETVRQEAICGCALDAIEKAFTQREFLAIDDAVAKRQDPHTDLRAFVRTCAAQLTVPKKT